MAEARLESVLREGLECAQLPLIGSMAEEKLHDEEVGMEFIY